MVLAWGMRKTAMTDADKNLKFLNETDPETKDQVLSAIAKHYGITKKQAWDEVTVDPAEHLLDYLTGHIRTVTHLLMRQKGLA